MLKRLARLPAAPRGDGALSSKGGRADASTASQIFDFLERHGAWNIDRHEIASSAFGTLRRSLRQITLRFRDFDDQLALDVLDGLRPLLSEWLTAPVPFDRSALDANHRTFRSACSGPSCAGVLTYGKPMRLYSEREMI